MAENINNSSKVKLNEVTKVTPFSDSTATTSFVLPLTHFDTFWFKFPPVERLFFFEVKNLTSDSFNSVILPNLKHSLSITLLHYLPLAGNITWPSLDGAKPAIRYSSPNDGVSVTVAESNANFAVLSGNRIREAVEFHSLITKLSISKDKAKVIAIQITFFPNEGFSIGISSHHATLDGKSSTTFVKSWAYLCKNLQSGKYPSQLPGHLTPCFDRTVIKDPKGLDMVYVRHWMAFTKSDSDPNPRSLNTLPAIRPANSNLVRKTFELSREDIKKLRQSKQVPHLSSFVITCAYMFVSLVKAKEVEDNKTVKFIVAADCRRRLDPSIPENYIGNCVCAVFVEVQVRDLIMEETGFSFAAEKLSDGINGLKTDDIEGSEEMIVNTLVALKEQGQVMMMTVAGSNRFDVYGLDFGWGKPKKVEVVSIDGTGAISLAESRDGTGGFEIGVVLEKQQMDDFTSLFVNGLKHV